MPKIKLTNDEVLEVSLETAIRVNKEWEDGKKKIKVGSENMKASRIRGVDLGSGTRTKAYDLSNEDDKRIIKDFERELEEARMEELEHPLEYYGQVVREMKWVVGPKKGKIEKFDPPLVHNDIVGLESPGIVQHLLKQEVISRREIGSHVYWAYVSPNCNPYIEKENGLDELKSRREYAQRMDKEAINSIVEEAGEKIIKKIPE